MRSLLWSVSVAALSIGQVIASPSSPASGNNIARRSDKSYWSKQPNPQGDGQVPPEVLKAQGDGQAPVEGNGQAPPGQTTPQQALPLRDTRPSRYREDGFEPWQDCMTTCTKDVEYSPITCMEFFSPSLSLAEVDD